MGGGERRGRNRRVGGDVPYHSHCGQWSRCTSTDKGDRGMWDLRGRVRGGGDGQRVEGTTPSSAGPRWFIYLTGIPMQYRQLIPVITVHGVVAH